MVRGKHVKRREIVINTKSLALMVSLIVMLGLAVGVTLAWLMDSTGPITNTFSPSNIKITLYETNAEFKMVPGHTINKDPVVKLHKGSEPCYLFIEVKEKDAYSSALDGASSTYTFGGLIAYSIDSNWEQLVDSNGNTFPYIYYRVVDEYTAEDKDYSILTSSSYTFKESTYSWSENQVLTKPEVTKETLSAIDKNNGPANTPLELTFKAYAFQLYKNSYKNSDAKFKPYEAWEQIIGYTS